jgi:hypothetical protein
MPEPVEWLVVKDLQAAIRGIAMANGYHFDVEAAAVKLDPNQDVPTLLSEFGRRPFVILAVGPETREYFPSSVVVVRQPVTVHWISDSVPTDDNSRLQTFLRGCSDIERAIATDITRGGLALDTRIQRRTFELAEEGSQVWAAVDLEITIHRTYGAPDA